MTAPAYYYDPWHWQPPPPPPPAPAVVFGELHADGKRVILICAGDYFAIKDTGTALKELTAALTVEDKTAGIISLPCTWVNITQLSHSFTGADGTARWVPGPRLCQWVVEELTRRAARPDRSCYPELPCSWELRDYQVAAAAAVAQLGRFLVFDEPGLGKTAETLIGLEWRRRLGHEVFPLVVITPAWAICDVWAREKAVA